MLGCIFGWIRNILAIIGLITVIIAIVIGVLIWSFTKPSAIEGEMHEVSITDEAVASFDAEWNDLKEGIKTQIKLTEAEISSKATKMAGELGIPVDVKKVWVNFFEGGSVGVRVAIVGTIFGLDVHVAGEGVVDIHEEDGKRVLYYRIDDLSLPSQLKSVIEENIEQRLDIEDWNEGTWELPEGWDVELTDINVEQIGDEYQLVIQGQVTE